MTTRRLAQALWWSLLGVALVAVVIATIVTRATSKRTRLSPTARQAKWRALLRQGASALPTYGRVPAFLLTDHHGQPVTHEQLLGSVWIADFIFTRCAGQCLMMTSQMAALQRALPSSVHLVSFTVDPAYDTPTVLSSYAARVGAQERWVFATGEPVAIRQLAREGFHLSVEEQGGTPQEPIIHSVRFVLIDRQGMIRGYYDGTDPAALAHLQLDAHALVEQPAS